MKTYTLLAAGMTAFLLASCHNKDNNYDASGIFEATEVMVSAQGNGQLISFMVDEGQHVEAGQSLGYIDTVQLHLKKLQLKANITAVESRHYNVSRQIASIRQQIATQRNEEKRYENLLRDKAANRKQLDDIRAQIALLKKQLAAQTETLENNNLSLSGESSGLEAQIAQIDDQIQKCIISSPIRGTVLTKYAEQGELAIPGKVLFKTADMEHLKLRVYITADQLTTIKMGQKVKVYADMGKDERKEYPGQIVWIADQAEFTPKTIQTRDERANLVYAIKVAVKNDGYIKRGMYGDIKID